jgi:hypothetical protein
MVGMTSKDAGLNCQARRRSPREDHITPRVIPHVGPMIPK